MTTTPGRAPASRRTRSVLAMIAVVASLSLLGAPAAAAATDTQAVPPAKQEIGGICGTLLGLGTSAAGQNKVIAARGAGWVSMVLAAGCLAKDLAEYSKAFNASPEGIASIRSMKARYAGVSMDGWMRGAGCTLRERQPAISDSVEPARTYWDCSKSPYTYAD